MLHYRIEGEREPRSEGAAPRPDVVLLHGFMGAGADWKVVAEGLRRHARCVLVDLPGHGASVGLPPEAYTMDGAARALVDVLDDLGVERAVLVGYSMGGRLVLHAALRHPDRVRRLVLESASPGLRTAGERDARRASDEALAQRLETEDFERFLDAWYRQPLFESLSSQPGLLETIRTVRRRNEPHELARVLRGMGTGVQPSHWEHLERFDVSTLAVAGALDGKYVEVARRMALLSPALRTVIVPNAGHNVHAEFPKAFVDLLADFLSHP